MQHSPECQRQADEINASRALFTEYWPNHCTRCLATGQVINYDWVPYGSTTIQMPSTDMCPGCTAQNKCPICGYQHDDDWECDFCGVCGWSWGDDGAPHPAECECDYECGETEEEI